MSRADPPRTPDPDWWLLAHLVTAVGYALVIGLALAWAH